jgi:8-oxo-dGTP pyrophosphatase MutT (NUDIX family)
MKKTYSAGGVILNPDGKVLVVSQHGNSWSLPKGHVDPGEDALAAAKREIHEETGISELELVRELGTYERYRIGLKGGETRSELKVITMFLFRTTQRELKPVDPDNPEARWVEKGKVARLLTHEKDKEFFRGIKFTA